MGVRSWQGRLGNAEVAGLHHEFVFEAPRGVRLAPEIPGKRGRDAEHDVRGDAVVVVGEYLRDERLVAVLRNHEVDVRGAVRVSALRTQHLAARAVGGNGIARGTHRAEMESSFRIRLETSARVVVRLVLVLVFVESHRRSLPYV